MHCVDSIRERIDTVRPPWGAIAGGSSALLLRLRRLGLLGHLPVPVQEVIPPSALEATFEAANHSVNERDPRLERDVLPVGAVAVVVDGFDDYQDRSVWILGGLVHIVPDSHPSNLVADLAAVRVDARRPFGRGGFGHAGRIGDEGRRRGRRRGLRGRAGGSEDGGEREDSARKEHVDLLQSSMGLRGRVS